MARINYMTSVSVRFHQAGAELTVFGGITVLDFKVKVAIAEITAACPSPVKVPAMSQWRHCFDCDRNTDRYDLVLEGTYADIYQTVQDLKTAKS